MTTIAMQFPHECSIYRPQYGEAEYGGETIEQPEVAKNVVCFVQNASSNEVNQYAKKGMQVDIKAYFLTEPNLREGDRITITRNRAGTSYIGQTFEFLVVDDATAGHGIAWKGLFRRETDPVEPVIGS